MTLNGDHSLGALCGRARGRSSSPFTPRCKGPSAAGALCHLDADPPISRAAFSLPSVRRLTSPLLQLQKVTCSSSPGRPSQGSCGVSSCPFSGPDQCLPGGSACPLPIPARAVRRASGSQATLPGSIGLLRLSLQGLCRVACSPEDTQALCGLRSSLECGGLLCGAQSLPLLFPQASFQAWLWGCISSNQRV